MNSTSTDISYCNQLAQTCFTNLDPTVEAVCKAFENFFALSRGHDDASCVMIRQQFLASCQAVRCDPSQCSGDASGRSISGVEIGLIVFVVVAMLSACAIACKIVARKRSVSRRIGQFQRPAGEASPIVAPKQPDVVFDVPAVYPPPVSL